MSKLLNWAKLIFVFSVLWCAINFQNAEAKAIPTLQSNKTYKYDLDKDGKKEKIKYKLVEGVGYQSKLNIYINKKKKLSLEEQEASVGYGVTIYDINKKDKYLDIIVTTHADSDCVPTINIYRYKRGKLKKILSTNIGIHMKGFSINSEVEHPQFVYIYSSVAENQFGISVDTPVSSMFECFVARMEYKIVGGTLKLVQQKSYKLDTVISDYNYELAQSMKLYKRANKKSKVICKLKKGSKFTAKKIKFKNKEKNDNATSVMVYVKADNGKKGWMYFPKYKYSDNGNPYLVNPGMWG